jgi:DNA-binding beta-propeller fold protein YncE
MTRRELLARSAAGATVFGAAPAANAQAPWPARPVAARRGRAIAAHGRTLVVAHDLRDTVAIVRGRRRRIVDVGAQPLAVAVGPDVVAVATAGWDADPALVVLDPATGDIRRRRTLPFAARALRFAGERLVVAGGEQEGTLLVVGGPRVELGRVPSGLAVHGDRAWVALQADDRVAEVDLERGRIVRERRVAALPDRLAVAPDGRRLLVSHGGRDTRVTLLDGRDAQRLHAGRQPSAVAFTAAGAPLVALGGEDAVVRLGRRARRRVGAAPRDLAVAGRRFFTVSALSARIAEGRL